jgi:sirohydrochlorin cobaltochelatase
MISHHGEHEGLLVIGHGTREAAGLDEFAALVERVRAATSQPVEPCFLELARPTIAEGIGRLVDSGVRRVAVVPLLLFAAGHAKRDIPEAVAKAAAPHPGLVVRQTGALESHEQVLALSARRFQEAIAGKPPADPRQTLLLMVGRGSLDADATAEMHRFARLRAERTPVGRVLTCFLAMQTPSLAEGLSAAADTGFQRIVVQAHLLFHGQLYDETRMAVESRQRRAGPDWLLTSVLGPEPELAAAVMDRVRQVSFDATLDAK